MALESARIWRDVLIEASLPFFDTGSLHRAYRDDERDVAAEFAERAPVLYRCGWIGAEDTTARARAVVASGLQGGLERHRTHR